MKKRVTTLAYRDGSGMLDRICQGCHDGVDGKHVFPGMETVEGKMRSGSMPLGVIEALAWVERNIKVPLTEPQKAGIASFCP